MKFNKIRILLLAVVILMFVGNNQSVRAQVQTSETADANKTSAVPATKSGVVDPSIAIDKPCRPQPALLLPPNNSD